MSEDLLDRFPLDVLRRRTSVKWRHHPPDVLPLWVAEMDVPLAPAVVAAMTDAVVQGDVGYASGAGYAEAFAAFAAARWGWRPPDSRAALVPDVMRGVVEVLRLIRPSTRRSTTICATVATTSSRCR